MATHLGHQAGRQLEECLSETLKGELSPNCGRGSKFQWLWMAVWNYWGLTGETFL